MTNKWVDLLTVKRKTASQAKRENSPEEYDRPKLRSYLEAVSARTKEGENVIGLRDTLDISPRVVWMEPEFYYLLQFMDGNHSQNEIRAQFLHQFGDFLLVDDYRRLIQQLDKNLMLDNARFHESFVKVVEEFRNLKSRPMTCAGSSYPADPEACAAFIDSEMEKITPGTDVRPSGAPIQALVLPHIDFRLGISSYLKGYSLFSQAAPSDLYIIIGTAHQGLTNPIALTTLDFDTPFGQVETDREMVKKVADGCEFDIFQDEYIFKKEHSVEFQAVMVKYFARKKFKILPILANFMPSEYGNQNSIKAARIENFARRLKKLLKMYRGNATIVASVDLAHIGPSYGDSQPPDRTFLAQMEKNDRMLLDALVRRDQARFQRTISKTENRFRICGYSPLTVLLDLLSDQTGRLLDYTSVAVDLNKSTVSFASLCFC